MAVDTDPVEDEDDLEVARRLVGGAERVVVLTGAGISTDSGIPDYRGPNGVWTKNPEAERNADIDVYVSDPEVRRRAWQRRLAWEAGGYRPNPGHRAVVALEQQGRLHTLITQNIDGLHHAAGSSPERVVEIHGTVHEATCLSCDYRAPIGEVLVRVEAGEPDPSCTDCGGVLKTATISFGQSLVDADLARAFEAARGADVFLAVGTSLAVYPVNETVPIAVGQGADLVIVNDQPTLYDRFASAVVREPISEALPRIVGTVPAGGD